MTRTFLCRLAAGLAAALLAACASGDPPELGHGASALGVGSGVVTISPDGGFVPGELMVRLDHPLTTDHVVLGGVAFTVVQQMPSGAWRLAIDDLAAVRTAALTAADLSDDDRAAAEANTVDAVTAVAAEPGVVGAYLNIVLELSAVPTDPLYPLQRWNYEAVNLPAAWDFGFGSSLVHLAIIDSESNLDQHPDLAPKWSGSADFITDGFVLTYHHGAHVAGIAGAATNNGIGGAGVCGGCKLDAYRISSRPTNLVEVEQAVHLAGGSDFGPGGAADAINLSINARFRPGSTTEHQTCSTPETAAFAAEVQRAIGRGATVVVSAGNFTDPGPAFPADCPGVISVAAIQPGGAIADYSNRGGGVTLAAPGGGGNGTTQFGASAPQMPCPAPPSDVFDPYSGTVGVMSSWVNYVPIDQIAQTDYCERYLSGTSMAAPHVTGTVGLMKSRNRNLLPAQITDILVRTAQTNTACPPVTCGAGLLDAGLAVRYAPLGGVPAASIPRLDLGNVAIGASATASASLTSTGSATMTPGAMSITGGSGQIEFAFPSGPCTSGTVCSQPIAPLGVNQLAAIPLRCKPTAATAISATLSITGDMLGGSAQATVTCMGIAVPDVTVTPTQLSFPDTLLGTSSAAQQVTVRNDGSGTLGVTASIADTSFALTCTSGCTCTSGACTANLGASQAMTLAVRFTPVAGPHLLTAALTIATPADPDEPSTTVALAGTSTAPLIGMDQPSFPFTAVGQSSFTTAHVSNVGTAPLHISQLVLSDITGVFTFSGTCDGLRVCPVAIDLAPGASTPVTMQFRPVRTQMLASFLTVTANSPDSPQRRAIWGAGFAPTLIIEGVTGFDFGNVPITTSATRDFDIYNLNGSYGTTLTWTASIAAPFHLSCVSGPCTCTAGTCSGSIGTERSYLRMTFTPTSPGPATASLVVQSNDPDARTRQLSAAGTGTLLIVGPPNGPGDPIDPAM